MSLNGRTDSQIDKPKFPKERQVRVVATKTANAVTSSSNTITLSDVTNLVVGLEIDGNNIVATSSVVGFLGGNCYITAINTISKVITITNPVSANVQIGDKFTFSNTIIYGNVIDNNYNANTYLATATRLANTSSNLKNQVAHAGWVNVIEGTGGRAGRIQTETLVALSNAVASSATSGGKYFSGK